MASIKYDKNENYLNLLRRFSFLIGIRNVKRVMRDPKDALVTKNEYYRIRPIDRRLKKSKDITEDYDEELNRMYFELLVRTVEFSDKNKEHASGELLTDWKPDVYFYDKSNWTNRFDKKFSSLEEFKIFLDLSGV